MKRKTLTQLPAHKIFRIVIGALLPTSSYQLALDSAYLQKHL